MSTAAGRYSAGVMLYDLMLEHTNTILVGEPAGGPRNHFGDAGKAFDEAMMRSAARHLATGDKARALRRFKKGLEINLGYVAFRTRMRVPVVLRRNPRE